MARMALRRRRSNFGSRPARSSNLAEHLNGSQSAGGCSRGCRCARACAPQRAEARVEGDGRDRQQRGDNRTQIGDEVEPKSKHLDARACNSDAPVYARQLHTIHEKELGVALFTMSSTRLGPLRWQPLHAS
eukprot:6204011-Pleurochrysis_carterae.AAC.4